MKYYIHFVILFCLFQAVVAIFGGGDLLIKFAEFLEEVGRMNTSETILPFIFAFICRILAGVFDFLSCIHLFSIFGENSITGLNFGVIGSTRLNSLCTLAPILIGIGFLFRMMFFRKIA